MRLYKYSDDNKNVNEETKDGLEESKPQSSSTIPEIEPGENDEMIGILVESFADTLISSLWSDDFPIPLSELTHHIGQLGENNFIRSMENIRTFLSKIGAFKYEVPINNKEDALQYIQSFSPQIKDLGKSHAMALLQLLGISGSRPEEISLETPIGSPSAKGEEGRPTLGGTLTDKNTPLSELLDKETYVDNLSRIKDVYEEIENLDQLSPEEADTKRGQLLTQLKSIEKSFSAFDVPEQVEKKVEQLSIKLQSSNAFQSRVEELKDKYGLVDMKDPKILAYAAQLDRMPPIKPGEFKEGFPVVDLSTIPDIAKTGASDIAKFLLIARLSESKVFLTRNQNSGSPVGGGMATKWPTTISGTDTFMDHRFSSKKAFVNYSGNISSLSSEEFSKILDKYLGGAEKAGSGRQTSYTWPMVFSQALGSFIGMPEEAMLNLGAELADAIETEDKSQIKAVLSKYKYNSYGVLTDTSHDSLSKNNYTFSSICTPTQMVKSLAEAKGTNAETIHEEMKGLLPNSKTLQGAIGQPVFDNRMPIIPMPPEALVAIAFYVVRLFIATCRANVISTIEEYNSNEKVQSDIESVINNLMDNLNSSLDSSGDFRLSGVTKAFTRPIIQTTKLQNFGVSVDKLKSLAMEGIKLSLQSGALLSSSEASFDFKKQSSFNREAIYNIATTLSKATLDSIQVGDKTIPTNMTSVTSGTRLTDFSSRRLLDVEKAEQHGRYSLSQPEQIKASTSETVRRSMGRMSSLVDNCNLVSIIGVEQSEDATVFAIRSNSSPVIQNGGKGAKITIYTNTDGKREEVLSSTTDRISVKPSIGDDSGRLAYKLFISPAVDFSMEDFDYELSIGQEIMYQARLATEKNTLDVWIREVNKELFKFNEMKSEMIQAISSNNLSRAMEVMRINELSLRVDLNRFKTLNSDYKSIVDSVMNKIKDKEDVDAYSIFIKDYVFKCIVAINQIRTQIVDFKKQAAIILGVGK